MAKPTTNHASLTWLDASILDEAWSFFSSSLLVSVSLLGLANCAYVPRRTQINKYYESLLTPSYVCRAGGACAAAVEEGDRYPPWRPAAHPERDHRDPFL